MFSFSFVTIEDQLLEDCCFQEHTSDEELLEEVASDGKMCDSRSIQKNHL